MPVNKIATYLLTFFFIFRTFFHNDTHGIVYVIKFIFNDTVNQINSQFPYICPFEQLNNS